MLTPVEIQSKTFKSGGLGYDKKDVDSFIREVCKSYENVYRENMELKDKLAVLNEGIQYYKSIEKTMQKALVLAEKTAEETKVAANKDAKRIEKEAAAKANIMLADAKNELDRLHSQTIALIQQYEKYKVQFKNLAKAQIELIESDAYSINVQKLDAFISENASAGKQNSENEVKEITSEETETDSRAEKYTEEQDDDFDFSDIEIDGQEEFDFLSQT